MKLHSLSAKNDGAILTCAVSVLGCCCTTEGKEKTFPLHWITQQSKGATLICATNFCDTNLSSSKLTLADQKQGLDLVQVPDPSPTPPVPWPPAHSPLPQNASLLPILPHLQSPALGEISHGNLLLAWFLQWCGQESPLYVVWKCFMALLQHSSCHGRGGVNQTQCLGV